MRIHGWRLALSALLVITGLDCLTAASGQDYPDIPGYVPGTPPWVPLIDQCMSAGGQRNDCIEALPPDIYADFLAAERARAAERAALLQLPRTPRVPSAQDLPEIYQTPALLPELPAGLAGALTDSGCLIPKSLDGNSNVVFAELAATGQEDIAVICSVDGVSRIQIFWGGPASCPPIDNSSPDWALLYRTVDWEYYWAISRSTPVSIRHYYDIFPEECSLEDVPPLIHDGLEDIFIEKGSSNHYCHEGRWLRLCGGD